MIHNLLRTGTFIIIALWLRQRWKGLIPTLISVFIIWMIHGEYLDYALHSNNKEYLELSYFLKWGLLTTVGTAYYLFIEKPIIRNIKLKSRSNSALSSNKSTKPADIKKLQEDDGFDFLRKKTRLKSRAEKILDKEIE